MKRRLAGLTVALTLLVAVSAFSRPRKARRAFARLAFPSVGGQAGVDRLVSRAEVGRSGGQLVVIQRAEPRTLNPVIAIDSPSRDVVWRTMADLIHINRETQQTEPALARSWTVSPDGRRFTLSLRRGVRFSDGDPFDADDVLFSFQVYMDEKVAVAAAGSADRRGTADRRAEARSVHRSSRSGGAVRRRGAAVRQHRDASASPARETLQGGPAGGGMGAWERRRRHSPGWVHFASRNTCPGERIVLERNPFYWKADRAGNRCRISTGSCSCSCRAKTRRRCGSSRARPTSPPV